MSTPVAERYMTVVLLEEGQDISTPSVMTQILTRSISNVTDKLLRENKTLYELHALEYEESEGLEWAGKIYAIDGRYLKVTFEVIMADAEPQNAS